MASLIHSCLATAAYVLLMLVTCLESSKSINNVGSFVATDTIQSENFTSAVNYYNYWCLDIRVIYVGLLDPRTVLEYADVDFGLGLDTVTFRISNRYKAQVIVAVHLDDYEAPPIANLSIGYTWFKDYCHFKTLSFPLGQVVSGVHDLYFTFPSEQGGVIDMDWFTFNLTERVPINALNTTIEAEDYTYLENAFIINDCDPNVYYASDLSRASVIEFDGVDFGSGVDMVTLRVANFDSDHVMNVNLHLDSPSSPPVASLAVGPTGLQCTFITLSAFIPHPLSGVHDLFFTFPSQPQYRLYLDWFLFTPPLYV